MKIPGSLLGFIEIALNRYVALDESVLADCEALSGKTLAIQLRDFDAMLYLQPGKGGIRVAGEVAEKPDASISGSLASFSRLLLPRVDEAELLLSGVMNVDGDSELAESFAKLLRKVHFDPEELLASRLGSAAAHTIGNFLRSSFGAGRRTVTVLGRDTAEYLREETRDLVHRADVKAWMNDVDMFRDDVERLEARVQRLEQRLVQRAPVEEREA